MQLPFGMTSVWDMFQRKTYEMFQVLPNAFGIMDDILITGFGTMGGDHNATLSKVLRICQQANLNFKIDNAHSGVQAYHFGGGDVAIRGELISKKSTGNDNHATTKC